MAPLVIGGLLSLGGAAANWYGANKAMEGLDGNLEEVRKQLEPWWNASQQLGGQANNMFSQGSDYHARGAQYMDANSAVNQQARQGIQESTMDFLASQGRQTGRNMSSGGMGGFSGLQAAQSDANYQRGMVGAEESFQNQLQGNRQLGLNLGQLGVSSQQMGSSLLDKFVQQQKGHSETMAQGWLQNDALKRQATASQWGGLASGLTNFATGFMG
tara:strand:- start:4 stop:648 length:645 start_codon:yes stop_codon:yes gene_type:complete